jgi:EAL domain-containing protein (putative c-di-GMP-specific phosphodiesterase class I)
MIGLCERLGAHMVAEGIERDQQLDAVRAFGATWGQGYLLGRARAAVSVMHTERAMRDRLTA